MSRYIRHNLVIRLALSFKLFLLLYTHTYGHTAYGLGDRSMYSVYNPHRGYMVEILYQDPIWGGYLVITLRYTYTANGRQCVRYRYTTF